MTDLPSWATEMARELADAHDRKMQRLYRPTASDRHAAMIDLASQALLAAYQRGERDALERAADAAFRVAQNVYATVDDVFASVRSLSPTQPEAKEVSRGL